VASIFFVLILGIVEFGRFLMWTHLLTNGARAGCRYAVSGSPYTTNASTGTSNNGNITTANVQSNVVANMSSVGVTLTTSQVSVLVRDSTSNDVSAAKSGDEITVKFTNLTFDSWVPTAGFLTGFNPPTWASYTMRHE
jgi:Flp pilus assembly protein TadG